MTGKIASCFQNSIMFTSEEKERFSVYKSQDLDAQQQILYCAPTWLFQGKTIVTFHSEGGIKLHFPDEAPTII